MSTAPSPSRDDRVAAVIRATADLAAAHGAYGQRVAERLGLAATDIGVLRLLAAEGTLPVGRIGELTGLTTGAATRMVDRLEQAGVVRRVADPADRRRVLVEPAGDRAVAVQRAFDPVDEAAARSLAGLDDPALAALHDYLATYIATLRAAPGDDAGAAEAAVATGAPIASATAGKLAFVTGAPSVRIAGSATLGPELYRARFWGATPSARVRDGAVTIRYPRFAWFDWRARVGDQWIQAAAHWRRDRGEIELNAALAWAIELRGVTALEGDLRLLPLRWISLAGGAGSVKLRLGPPSGKVVVRLRGGADTVDIERPFATPTVLTLKGGCRTATLDGAAADSPGRIATPDAEHAPDRLELEILGGANTVVVRAAR